MKYIQNIHQCDWNKTVTQYKEIHPNINTIAQLLHPQRVETLITTLKLGKCFLDYYSFRIQKHPTGMCDLCHTNNTIEHFLLNCKNPIAIALTAWSITSNKTLNLATVLNEPEAIHIIITNNIRKI